MAARRGAPPAEGILVGRLTAAEDGSYPVYVVVDGPLGERTYRPRPAACSNIDSDLGARSGGAMGFTCSACWEQLDRVPRFCPGCGAKVRG